MGRTYNVIDSDGYVLEPRTFWQDYIDPQFRDRAPTLITDANGKERFLVEGKLLAASNRALANKVALATRTSYQWRITKGEKR